MLKKILCGLIALFTISVAFAMTLPANMNIEVSNQLLTAGNPILIGNSAMDFNYGPILEKNKQRKWLFTPHDELYSISWGSSSGLISGCEVNGNAISLDPEKYSGDVITISIINKNPNGGFNCSCSGSACTASISKK